MKLKIVICLLVSLVFTASVYAEDIVVSWASNGVVMAEGMVAGSTCTVERASSLDESFTNATEYIVFNDMVADSNGTIRLAVPMFFRVRGIPKPTIPAGMVRIPGGTNSGSDPDYGDYSLTVDTFYMDATEVTKVQWDEVYDWAIDNGYSFDNVGSGKASNHPVHSVSWYDCVKWCNARSEKEGRTPCYTVNGSIYKTGQSAPICTFSANGYRLPTSEEWEYAARGALISKRFPCGDTITHNSANYYSYWSDDSPFYSYDVSTTRGYHPDCNDGEYPYTSPAGYFSPNGYGLYDMAGNVWEWCNTTLDAYMCVRGGCWSYYANNLRIGSENWQSPYISRNSIGFRAVCR